MKNLMKKVRFFSILWEKYLEIEGCVTILKNELRGFFSCLLSACSKEMRERFLYLTKKRDEKGNQSNAQRSGKSSRIQRDLHKKD